MYTLTYSDKFTKQIKKLDRGMQGRIVSSLERCRIRPYSHAKKMLGSPYFGLRVGVYRVIIDIQKNQLRILVIMMGHRKDIYKKIK